MEILIGVVVIGLIWFLLARGKSERRKQEELYDLRIFEDRREVSDDEWMATRVDLATMTMSFSSNIYGIEDGEPCQVRRLSASDWQYNPGSKERKERIELLTTTAGGEPIELDDDEKRLLQLLNDGDWVPLGSVLAAKIEPQYQLFLARVGRG